MMKQTSLAEARVLGAQLIESVLAGNLTPELALNQWPLPINSAARTLTVAWTRLSHYADDKELLEADPEYAKVVRQRLQELAQKLQTESIQLGDSPSRGIIKEFLHSIVSGMKK